MFGKSKESMHAEQLWKYLDDLAENNPEEYKKFISQQMKNGLQYEDQNKSNKENPSQYSQDLNMLDEMFSLKTKKSLPCIKFMCLRFKLKKIKQITTSRKDQGNNILSKEEIAIGQFREVPKILFSTEFTSQAFSNDILQEPKIYLNLICSEDFYPPLNKENRPETKSDLWNYIPTLFRYNGEKSSMRGVKCLFYDVIINTIVMSKSQSNEKLKSSILAYIARKFSIFLNDEFDLYMSNVKIVSNHKYKSINNNPHDFEIPSKSIENLENKQEKIISENFYDKNKLTVPPYSVNYPGDRTFYKDNEKAKSSKGNQKLSGIPGVFNAKISKPKDEENKDIDVEKPSKPIIEEIKRKGKINIINKKILNEHQMSISFDFNEILSYTEVEDISLSNIDLEISQNELKILLNNASLEKHYDPIFLSFDSFELIPDNCTAKFHSEEKVLTVVLFKKT